MVRRRVAQLCALLLLSACSSGAREEPPLAPDRSAVDRSSVVDPVLERAVEMAAAMPAGRWGFLLEIDVGDDGSGVAPEPIRTVVDGTYEELDHRYPLAWIDLLLGADPLEPDGVEVIDEVPHERYRAAVHLDRVRTLVPDERFDAVRTDLEELEGLIGDLGGAVDDPLEALLWVAPDGALRRYLLNVPVAPGHLGAGATARVAVELYGYEG